jgi:hypothetical protein
VRHWMLFFSSPTFFSSFTASPRYAFSSVTWCWLQLSWSRPYPWGSTQYSGPAIGLRYKQILYLLFTYYPEISQYVLAAYWLLFGTV